MKIREFKEEDASDIAEINYLIDEDERKSSDYLRWLDYPKNCINLVLEFKGKIVGRLLLDQLYKLYPELVNFSIHPEYQRRGLGTELVKEAFERSKINPLAIPTLKTSMENDPAIKLYNKLSFISVIRGTSTLNEWYFNLHKYPLFEVFLNETNGSYETKYKEDEDNNKIIRKEVKFTKKDFNVLKDQIKNFRNKYIIQMKGQESDSSLIFYISGQPDQIIGFIREDYCVPSFPPCITGYDINIKENKCMFESSIISEKGEIELRINNKNNFPLNLKIKALDFLGIDIQGIPNRIDLKPKSIQDFFLRISLSKEFDSKIFNYSSFEAVPLTLIIEPQNKGLVPFHLTNFFWYRLLKEN